MLASAHFPLILTSSSQLNVRNLALILKTACKVSTSPLRPRAAILLLSCGEVGTCRALYGRTMQESSPVRDGYVSRELWKPECSLFLALSRLPASFANGSVFLIFPSILFNFYPNLKGHKAKPRGQDMVSPSQTGTALCFCHNELSSPQ